MKYISFITSLTYSNSNYIGNNNGNLYASNSPEYVAEYTLGFMIIYNFLILNAELKCTLYDYHVKIYIMTDVFYTT